MRTIPQIMPCTQMMTIAYGPAKILQDQDCTKSAKKLAWQKQLVFVSWQSIRQNILKTVTESNAMPSNQVCTCCCMDLAMFKCFMCGPCTYFCGSCLEKQHTNSNIFHLPLQWKVSVLMQGLHHVLLFYRMVDMFR